VYSNKKPLGPAPSPVDEMVKLQDLARFGLSAMQNGDKFTVSWT
jgi:hypothetical protein